jgi:L-fuconate dehydratase
MEIDSIFADMGAFFNFREQRVPSRDRGCSYSRPVVISDPQHRWLGPEKGVIHLATAAVSNALWDMMAKYNKKPLWKLICDFTPEEFVRSTCFRYCTDFITPEEALALLKAKEGGKKAREEEVIRRGYPAYTTSVGWLGYSDEKVRRLTHESLAQGFNVFKVGQNEVQRLHCRDRADTYQLKVGADAQDDLRRGQLIRSIIDDPANMPKDRKVDPATVANKNAGPTGCVLMVDANRE